VADVAEEGRIRGVELPEARVGLAETVVGSGELTAASDYLACHRARAGAQLLAELQGPAAARVIRALCDIAPPYGIRKLAGIAGTPPASASRVVSLLCGAVPSRG
jgi:hypothetical protein